MSAAAPAEDVPYRLVVPAAWTRLPMDPAGMKRAARALLLQRTRDLPRDRTVQLRRDLEQELVALTRRAGSEYARMLLVLALEVHRRPISASCLVSLLPQPVPDEAALQALAASLADPTSTAVVEELGDNRGVVVVRDEVQALPAAPDGVDVEALAEQYADALGLGATPPVEGEPGDRPWTPGTTRTVEVWLPVPDSPRVLLLSFSTPLVPLFDALTELFLLIASTVQWERGGDDWR